ncbi:cholinesterase-like isoform X2 [Elgaria multicarinata webbii]|uniref:cholinesterase-like isoform X2 n=1 Tax=Elgaria multicarinata webbii TaxID=159646 RepID=UPI002FCCC7D8
MYILSFVIFLLPVELQKTATATMPGILSSFMGPFFLLLLCLLASSSASEDDTVVVTSSGPVKGKQVPAGSGSVTAYLGIPYAEPPVGKLRFQKSRPHQPWSHVLEATTYGNSCLQINNYSFPDAALWTASTSLSEDCLFLNIWVPHPRPSIPVPILVWIHGGGFIYGSASLDVYNGAFLAATENVIVASMNYRLGFLGFLYFPPDAPGNAGLWDQWLALKWVKENAAAFGGDPALLTLFGNSAGGASVGYHLLSPASQPLFAHAVLQSGAPNARWAWKDPEDAKSDALIIGTKLGCPEQNQSSLVSCLQGNNIGDKELYRLSTLVSVTTDGEFLLDEPLKLLQSGAVQSKPVLTGVTHDEGTVFVLASFPKTKSDDVILTLNDIIVGLNSTLCEDTVKAIAVRYSEGAPAPKSYRHILAEYFKDISFVCPCTQFASKMAEAGSPVYVYSFKRYTPRAEWPKWMGTTHGDELPYLFGTLATVLGTNQTDVDVALSHKVMRHWAEFARSGNPTGSQQKEEQWPLYNSTEQKFFHISAEAPQVKRLSSDPPCDFLKTIKFNANCTKESQRSEE